LLAKCLLGHNQRDIHSYTWILKVVKPEEFDPVKFLVTVTVGAISGYLAFALGWTQEAIAAWFATTGIIVWIEYGLKTFVRRVSTT